MNSIAVSEDPLSLHSAMRSFIADAITPISAFLALAQPGRSCLLESVEGTDRISRYSFIGIDYLEARVFDDDPGMISAIRALIGRYHLDTADLPFPGGAAS
jgi:anthranilate/para-aminobenzoate synthase component I